jgi:hypothetical protein
MNNNNNDGIDDRNGSHSSSSSNDKPDSTTKKKHQLQKKNVCKFCGSNKITKQGKSKAKVPKQIMFCNNCRRFYVIPLDNRNEETTKKI